MATQIYFDHTNAPSVSPAYGCGTSYWADTTQMVRRKMYLNTPPNTGTESRSVSESVSTKFYNVGAIQFVSEPLDAIPFSTEDGAFTVYFSTYESDTQADAFLHAVFAYCDSDGSNVTYLGYEAEVESDTAWLCRAISNTLSTDFPQGKRLIIEIGSGFGNSKTDTKTWYVRNTNNAGTDLAADDTANYNSHIYFPYITMSEATTDKEAYPADNEGVTDSVQRKHTAIRTAGENVGLTDYALRRLLQPRPVDTAIRTIGYVQSNSWDSDDATSTEHSIAFDSDVSAGNDIIVIVMEGGTADLTAIYDSLRHNYQFLYSSTVGNSMRVYRARVRTSGPCTVTVKQSAQGWLCLVIYEYANLGRLVDANGSSSTETASGTPQSSTITTDEANCLVISYIINEDTDWISIGPGGTETEREDTGFWSQSQDEIWSSPKTDNHSWITNGSDQYSQCIVAFAPRRTDVGVLDYTIAKKVFQRFLADSMGLSDSDKRDMDYARSPADDLGLTDDPQRILNAVRKIADDEGITDSAFKSQDFTRQVADDEGLTDSAISKKSLLRKVADQLGLTDSAQKYQDIVRALADIVGEGTRTNLIPYSKELINPVEITKSGYTTGPDGVSYECGGIASTTSAYHEFQNFGMNVSPSTIYAASGFVKSGIHSYGCIQFTDYDAGWGSAGYSGVVINSDTGQLVGSWGASNITITQYANGWWRVSFTKTTGSSAVNSSFSFGIPDPADGNYAPWSGDGSTISEYFFGAQVEQNEFSTSYIPTSADPVTKEDDYALRILSAVRAIADDAGITDSAQKAMSYVRTQADDIGVTDFAKSVKALLRAVADDMGVSDYALSELEAGAQTWTREIGDSVGVTDFATWFATMARYISESLGVSDEAQRVLDAIRYLADNEGITDVAERVVGYVREPSDAVGITDDAQRIASFIRAIVESQGISDSADRAITIIRSLADQADLSDDAIRRVTLGRIASDDVGVADYSKSLLVLVRLLAEALGTTDSSIRTMGFVRGASEGIGFTDVSARSMSALRTIADSVDVTDDATRLMSYVRLMTDDVGVSDGVARILTQIRFVADSIDLLDSAYINQIFDTDVLITDAVVWKKVIAAGRKAADDVGITDYNLYVKVWGRAIAEEVGVTDDYEKVHDAIRSIADQAGATDVAQRVVGYVREPSDAVGVTDYGMRSLAIARSIADQLDISDAVTYRQIILWARFIYDNVGVADDAQRTFNASRFLADDISVSDFYATYKAMVRAIADITDVSDAAKKASEIARIISDSADVTDAVARLVISGIAIRIIADDLSVSDEATPKIAKVRQIAESLGITDFDSISKAVVRAIGENVNLSDYPRLTKSMVRFISETEGVTDDATRTMTAFRSLADDIGLTDAVSRSLLVLLQRAVADDVGVTDAGSRILHVARSLSESLGIVDFDAIYREIVRSLGESVGVTYDVERVMSYIRPLAESVGLDDELFYQNLAYLTRYIYLAENIGVLDGVSARTFIVSWMAIQIAASRYIHMFVASPFIMLAASKAERLIAEEPFVDIAVATPYITLEVWK